VFFLDPRGRDYFPVCPHGGYGPGELWVTDGTPAGTYRVGTGPASGLGFLGDLAYFGSSPASGPGAELRVTDGRPGVGRKVITLRRDRPGSDPQFLPSGNGMLIAAAPGTGDAGLWTSDGTRSGTLPLFDFPPDGVPKFFGDFLGDLGSVQLMSVVHEDKHDYNETPELWRTDGTPQGTRLLKVFPAETYLDPQTAVAWNGRLLFVEEDAGGEGCSLWSADGTPDGTRQIPWAPAKCPLVMTPWGDRFLSLVFSGDHDRPLADLYLSDGTPAGTRRIASLAGLLELYGGLPVRLGGTLFFGLESKASELQLWQTDGTPEGTRPVPPLKGAADFHAFRGSLYLTAALPEALGEGRGLYRYSPGGSPVLLAKLLPYSENAFYVPLRFAPAGGRLLFLFKDYGSDPELWATDGTPAGTRRLRGFEPLPSQPLPDPEDLVSAGGRVFFAASDGVHGRELWESDGTPEGTRMVVDLAPGGYSSIPFPSTLAASKNYLFFAADDGKAGLEPWALPLAP
jgi:ELWxxDGT repeat protein